MLFQRHVRKDSPIEGRTALWYARTTAMDLPEFERLADKYGAQTAAGGAILDLATGPGYLAVALARRGFSVTGVDLSGAMVDLARRHASQAGVAAHFIQGNASRLELPDERFDLVICRAAFKNFADPRAALEEMYRVTKPGGRAVILDLRHDADQAAISQYVDDSGRRRFDAWLTKVVFRVLLSRRAYADAEIQALAARSRFGACEITKTPIGFEACFRKAGRDAPTRTT